MPDKLFLNAINHIREELSTEDIRWARPENYHITLLFLGDTDQKTIQTVDMELHGMVKDFNDFHFFINGLGIFRSITYPRVLYAGLRETEMLVQLNRELQRKLNSLININDEKDYTPHLTLGRMKKFSDRDTLSRLINEYRSYDFLRVEAKELIFYESVSTRAGVAYHPVSIHNF